jgi:chromosome segregation protein
MFKLQRLEITGFKSFADHTNIVFTGDGITAVVGPNGCGKSNVADAIAWVLGEQRAKQLRGSDMKDVIFQGSRNRQPGGMAEVILHLVRDETVEDEPNIDDIDSTLESIDDQRVSIDDLEPKVGPVEELADAGLAAAMNEIAIEGVVIGDAVSSDSGELQDPQAEVTHPKTQAKRHWRPKRPGLDFAPGESVSVARRIYRSGESEYLLNGKQCRLRDIQDLFSGTGLGGAHYAIIEQGRIGQILSAKPMDRRTLIEEAAGITKFRVRQRATETRLESARSNLSRLSDIISEIERQVNSLRRQAAKARRYRVMREELRELLRCVYVAEEFSLGSLLDETREKLVAADSHERSLIEELTALEDEARLTTQDARNSEDELASIRAAAAESELLRDRRSRERSFKHEQAEALEIRRTEIESELTVVRERLSNVIVECKRLRDEEAAICTVSEESALVLQTVENRYGQRVFEVAKAEELIERTRSELLKHTAASERLMEIARQLDAAIDRLALQDDGLLREGERAATNHAERVAESETLDDEIARARENLARLTTEREEAVHKVIGGHERVSETEAELTRYREDYSRARHRLDSLTELENKRSYYSEAIQKIYAGGVADEFHFMGTLADMVQVEPRWERVVEGAFGSILQSIIVPTPDDAARAAMWLRANEAGRASFLVAGLHGASDDATITAVARKIIESVHITESTENLTGIRLGDLLGASPELLTVLRRTLPQRMNARITATLDDAISMSLSSGEMFVTLEGDWVAGGQLVNAGNERALEEGAGLLTFKRELRELEASATEFSLRLAGAEQAHKQARASLAELEDAVVILNELLGREEREAMARELNARQLRQEIERAERHIRVVADDIERLEKEKRELQERREATLVEAAVSEGARGTASQQVTEATQLLGGARREAELENISLGEQRVRAAATAERRRATSTELRRSDAERADLEARLDRYGREMEEASARILELQNAIEEIDRGSLTAVEERANDEELIEQATARLAEARDLADRVAARLTELNHQAAEAREARSSLEVQQAEATTRLTYVRESCMAELNQSLENLARERTHDPDFNLEDGHTRVDDLRNRIDNFGAVNMMALEELAENEQRYEFLTRQRDDIVNGIASTEEALREIKRRSRERFRDAFEKINKNFGELFRELFGGGHGEMSLIDAEDVLESGIDIIAQPPGKRLQSVLLLSGGEKAMAALALTMGIFQYRPSPFCLLDEVDAPLDEANVGRFTNKIREMAEHTQFIIITHNKRTMEMARALYGVTMEEVGISKLVSVRFE